MPYIFPFLTPILGSLWPPGVPPILFGWVLPGPPGLVPPGAKKKSDLEICVRSGQKSRRGSSRWHTTTHGPRVTLELDCPSIALTLPSEPRVVPTLPSPLPGYLSEEEGCGELSGVVSDRSCPVKTCRGGGESERSRLMLDKAEARRGLKPTVPQLLGHKVYWQGNSSGYWWFLFYICSPPWE